VIPSICPRIWSTGLEIRRINEELVEQGKQPARYIEILLGVTKAALETDSFLSASSFQHTIKVLSAAAVSSREDPLFGLKENIMIGKLIPAGTGFEPGSSLMKPLAIIRGAVCSTVVCLDLFDDDIDALDLFDDEDADDFDDDLLDEDDVVSSEDLDEDLDDDDGELPSNKLASKFKIK
jgi:DNA-directed RNA polymerase subunit beta'